MIIVMTVVISMLVFRITMMYIMISWSSSNDDFLVMMLTKIIKAIFEMM